MDPWSLVINLGLPFVTVVLLLTIMPPTLVAMLDERQDANGVHPHNHPDAPGLTRHTTITITIVIAVVAGLILLASAFHFVRRARSRRHLEKRLQEAASQPRMHQQTAATSGYSSFFNPTGVAPTTTAPSPASPSRPASPRTSQGREVHTTVSHPGPQSKSVEGRPRSNVHQVLSWSPSLAESPASQPSRVAVDTDRPPDMNTRAPLAAFLSSPETPPPQYEALH
ncbi:hypothetical protein CYLTODRAFT_259815 [Cylindrobasidium torrendii FP15055 ss-10]|uniref:Transmembrane protein n=1 Tax=Cylindrobasidium torrendii FP15055 ss-10 TaxID=1314674 RepID=A0A0D7BDB6_9AGAR|nr:hypothetical protein CYLTODRAFT_259815 [Cylindrobasidium torrendii FP15055 ss-10]